MKYPELSGFKFEGRMSIVAYLETFPLVDYLISIGVRKKIVARMLEKRKVGCLISFGIKGATTFGYSRVSGKGQDVYTTVLFF